MDGTEAPSKAILNQRKSVKINILRQACSFLTSIGIREYNTHSNCTCSIIMQRVKLCFAVFLKPLHNTFPRISELQMNKVTCVPVTEKIKIMPEYLNIRFESNKSTQKIREPYRAILVIYRRPFSLQKEQNKLISDNRTHPCVSKLKGMYL